MVPVLLLGSGPDFVGDGRSGLLYSSERLSVSVDWKSHAVAECWPGKCGFSEKNYWKNPEKLRKIEKYFWKFQKSREQVLDFFFKFKNSFESVKKFIYFRKKLEKFFFNFKKFWIWFQAPYTWGTYRPHMYFGLRTRSPISPLFGMMWYEQPTVISRPGIRHWCNQGDYIQFWCESTILKVYKKLFQKNWDK